MITNDSSPDFKDEPAPTPTPAHDIAPTAGQQITKKEIKAIDKMVLDRLLDLLKMFSKGGHLIGSDWAAFNPRRQDRNPVSFKYHVPTGKWKDYGGGEKCKGHRGSGLCSYVAHFFDISIEDAAARVSAAFGSLPLMDTATATSTPETQDSEIGWTYQVATEIPSKDSLATPSLGIPSQIYIYYWAPGKIAFIIRRWDLPNGEKVILPWSYWVDAQGVAQWRPKHAPMASPLWNQENAPSSWPVYNLLELIERLNAPVLVVEGEKSADAAKILFPGHVVVTWAGGADLTKFTNWSTLAKRTVVIWPDNDDAGYSAAASIKSLLNNVEAEVRTLSDSEVTTARRRVFKRIRPSDSDPEAEELPKKYDAANAAAEGWNESDLIEILSVAGLPPGFTERNGIIYKEIGGGSEDPTSIKVCSHIDVLAKVRDSQNESWGRLVRWTDGEGVEHTSCIAMHVLGSDTGELASRLLSGGMIVITDRGARSALHELLLTAVTTRLLRCVTKVGWHGPIYVLGDERGTVISPDGHAEGVILQTGAVLKPRAVAGTAEGWKSGVAALCAENSRLIFALCIEFAAPLLDVMAAESGGYHFMGSSSIGKTTLLLLAASVFGNRPDSWRTTDNGLEAVAAMHNDAALKLDEINECDPKRIGGIAYMLANGTGKSRMSKNVQLREQQTWRLLFISTGEISLADHLNGAGLEARAGQEVRFSDIPADAGAGIGCFEDLHGEPNGHAFAERIRHAVQADSGTAGPAFLREVVQDRDGAVAFIGAALKAFTAKVVPPGSDGQVYRVAERFGLVAAAGELASGAGVTGWSPGVASTAAETCFQAWLTHRAAGTGSSEAAKVLERVRRVILKDGASAFDGLKAEQSVSFGCSYPITEPRTTNRLGWWRPGPSGGREFLFTPESWKQIFYGLDPKFATATLLRLGFLIPDKSRKGQQVVDVPGLSKRTRLYVVASAVLGDAGSGASGTPEHQVAK